MNPQDLANDINDELDDGETDVDFEHEPRVDAGSRAAHVPDEWLWRTCGAFLCV
jgi:hypothetical protein